jgi:hypothetical protein
MNTQLNKFLPFPFPNSIFLLQNRKIISIRSNFRIKTNSLNFLNDRPRRNFIPIISDGRSRCSQGDNRLFWGIPFLLINFFRPFLKKAYIYLTIVEI